MASQIISNGIEHKYNHVINVGMVDKTLAAAWQKAWDNYNAAGYTLEQAFDENTAFWIKPESVSGAGSDGDSITESNTTEVTTAPNSPGDVDGREVSCKETVMDNEFIITDNTLWAPITLANVAATAIVNKVWNWPAESVAELDQYNSTSADDVVTTLPITTGTQTSTVVPEAELVTPVTTAEDEPEEAGKDDEGDAAAEVPIIPGPFIHKIIKAKKGAKKSQSTVPAPATTQINDVEPPKMATRRLVTVRNIDEVCDVPDYPDQVVVKFDGWQVVAPRSMGFQKWGAAVFFEPDAFLPADKMDCFKKLHPQTTFKGTMGYVVGTRKYGKQISQGYIHHMKGFGEIYKQRMKWMSDLMKDREEDQHWDYSEELGVVKFTLDDAKAEEQIDRFPVWLKDADMKRVQNLPITFNHRKYEQEDMRYQETVKLDGCTMTCYHIAEDHLLYRSLPQIPEDNELPYYTHAGRFGVCSKNCDLKYRDDSVFWKAAKHYRIRHLLSHLNMNIAIQGELVGSTINGNHQNYKDGEHEFFVFGIWDINAQERWAPEKVVDFCREHGLDHVPVKGYVKLPDIGYNAQAFLARATGTDGEGLVYKGVGDGRWFKAISTDWEMRTQMR